LAFKVVTKPPKSKTINLEVKPSLFWLVRTLTNSSKSSESSYKMRGIKEERGEKEGRKKGKRDFD
jgi:hypothetical protein